MSVTAAAGFVAAGVACGIKASGEPDLSLVATADGVPVAATAVFTDNKMTAAPVLVSESHLRTTLGRAAAVVLNSGNANAATGARGIAEMCLSPTAPAIANAVCDATGTRAKSIPIKPEMLAGEG